jgi:predicted dehydrogenase
MHNRRDFLKAGSVIAASAGFSSFIPFDILAANRKWISPSDRINVAAIGINGQGWADLNAMMKSPEVNVVALCDVDENVLNKRKQELAYTNINVRTSIDYRDILNDKTVDAVIIGTPDHWHCRIMIDACAAGKDVYCEKPVGRTIEECRLMVTAQQKYNRAVQVGQWQRSMKHFKDAVDFVQSGKLGRIRLVKSWAYQGWMKPIPVRPDEATPAGVHYDKWLGPAPGRPFNPNRFHFNFRWFYDYAGGLMTDWGVHLIDYAMLGMKAGYAKSAAAIGGKNGYPDDAEQWPDTMATVYDFGDFDMLWEQAVGINVGPYNRDHGIAYTGNNGTLVLDRGGWEVIPEQDNGVDKMQAVSRQKAVDNGMDNHTRNFIEVVKSRNFNDLHTPVQAAALVAINCHMGNIAHLTKQTVHWDANAFKFEDEKSNQYIVPQYHNGYKLPVV